MPTSLNQVDFKYFAELLFQYIDTVKSLKHLNHEQLKKEFLVVNMYALFKSIGSVSGGRSFKLLLTYLEKLSKVHMKYDKVIDKETGSFQKSGGSLITYDFKQLQSKDLKPQIETTSGPDASGSDRYGS